jgi:predicted ATP-grasp superfamily ATP-dependent carboligase
VRVFIYEFTNAVSSAELSLSDSLRTEGWAMLSGLLKDFSRLSGLEVCGILDASRQFELSGKQLRRIKSQEEEAVFRELVEQADFTLVIAPEFNEILATRCRWVEEADGRLLGPNSAAVRLTGDKLAFGRRLQEHRISTPSCEVFAPGNFNPPFPFPLVCKPRYGAGSLATFLVKDANELAECREQARAEGWQGEMLVQPFVPGYAASVAFLIGPSQRLALLPAAQHLSTDGRFHYLGGSVPLPAGLAQRALRLASQAVEAVPGLSGYVGVDLVLGSNHDGSQDFVIEINPRLTTSYIGLRVLAKANLAEAMLRVVGGEMMHPLDWHRGAVHFKTDGTFF